VALVHSGWSSASHTATSQRAMQSQGHHTCQSNKATKHCSLTQLSLSQLHDQFADLFWPSHADIRIKPDAKPSQVTCCVEHAALFTCHLHHSHGHDAKLTPVHPAACAGISLLPSGYHWMLSRHAIELITHLEYTAGHTSLVVEAVHHIVAVRVLRLDYN
jgi:hypothetical protein